jgi:hypothetical protein
MRRCVEMQSGEKPQLADSGDILTKTKHFDRSAIVWRGAADAHSYAERTRAGEILAMPLLSAAGLHQQEDPTTASLRVAASQRP